MNIASPVGGSHYTCCWQFILAVRVCTLPPWILVFPDVLIKILCSHILLSTRSFEKFVFPQSRCLSYNYLITFTTFQILHCTALPTAYRPYACRSRALIFKTCSQIGPVTATQVTGSIPAVAVLMDLVV